MGNSSSKNKQLTLKQRKWRKVYFETGNATEAARQAYNCKTDAAASQVGYENLRKLEFSINEMMDEIGISEAKILKVLDRGLEASKTIVEKIDGEVEVIPDVPDFANIHKFLVTALKLRGLLRDRLSLEDPDGKPLGPVILPIKEGDEQKFTTGADSDDD